VISSQFIGASVFAAGTRVTAISDLVA